MGPVNFGRRSLGQISLDMGECGRVGVAPVQSRAKGGPDGCVEGPYGAPTNWLCRLDEDPGETMTTMQYPDVLGGLKVFTADHRRRRFSGPNRLERESLRRRLWTNSRVAICSPFVVGLVAGAVTIAGEGRC